MLVTFFTHRISMGAVNGKADSKHCNNFLSSYSPLQHKKGSDSIQTINFRSFPVNYLDLKKSLLFHFLVYILQTERPSNGNPLTLSLQPPGDWQGFNRHIFFFFTFNVFISHLPSLQKGKSIRLYIMSLHFSF